LLRLLERRQAASRLHAEGHGATGRRRGWLRLLALHVPTALLLLRQLRRRRRRRGQRRHLQRQPCVLKIMYSQAEV
jgi:hypothetical protein